MKQRTYLLALLITFTTSACKKFVVIPPPPNELTTTTVFSDSADCVTAVTGLYVDLMQSFGAVISNGGITIFTGLSSDEIYYTSFSTDQKEFYNNSVSPGNLVNQTQLWAYAYKLIYDANACIEGIANATSVTYPLQNRLISECKFIRAFLYFNLTNLFGAVPLIRNTDYHTNQLLPRTPTEDIYKQIISDLNECRDFLRSNNGSVLHPSADAVAAFLAKVYLYQQNWQRAATEADIIINSGRQQLEEKLENVFAVNSVETIFALCPVIPNRETIEGFYFVPTSPTRRPTYALTSALLGAFETGDGRLTNWTKKNVVGGQEYFYPFKYRNWFRSVGASLSQYYTIFRLADIFLIRAEARTHLDEIPGALNDINRIRERAGIGSIQNLTTQEQVLEAIWRERRIELFCEWGNRWFDLKRTRKADSELSALKANWEATDVLYPVPQFDRDNNPNLSQNAGY